MATRTIELDRNDLDKGFEVLSSAAQALQLTRFENLAYRALMLSADVAAVSFVAAIVPPILQIIFGTDKNSISAFYGVIGFAIVVCILVGTVSLMLNVPLFVRVFRERARLKKLGLSSLSKSLWMESWRSRWITRARGVLLIVAITYSTVTAISIIVFAFVGEAEIKTTLLIMGLFYVIVAGLLFAARYLRNQRERMGLAADAEELRRAVQKLRERAGNAEVVTVPSEFLEQTAKIESARIASERKDAVLQSIASPSKEYAVAFDRSAVEQRATLDVADRMELEDLVEQLGAEATESQAGAGTITALRAATKSKRIEINYLIDQASRRIRITTVRPGVGGCPASPSGAAHA